MRISQTTDPAVGGSGHLESFYREEAGGKDTNGADVVNAYYYRSAYRHGRVVYLISIDAGSASNKVSATALTNRLNAAVTSGPAAIEARLIALGV